jgi:DNA-binding transcriptional LysR family regulator
MRSINIKQVEAFVLAAELGSFRRAGDALNTTQPNISARIAALEGLLNRKLLDRDAGSVTLTPAGSALIGQARAILASVDDLLVAANEPELFHGRLRLGVTEMIVHSWLADFLAAFSARFPNVDTELLVDFSANLSEALNHRTIDLALQSGPFETRTSGSMELGAYPLAWVASPRLGLGATKLTIDEFARFPILTYATHTQPYRQMAHYFRNDSNVRVRLMPSTNLAASLKMTLEGLGIACLPQVMVGDLISTGDLQRLDFAWLPDDLVFEARFDSVRAPHYVKEAAMIAAEVAADVAWA